MKPTSRRAFRDRFRKLRNRDITLDSNSGGSGFIVLVYLLEPCTHTYVPQVGYSISCVSDPMCQARCCLPPGLLANDLMQLTTSHHTRLLLVLVSVVAETFVKKRNGFLLKYNVSGGSL